MTLNLGYTNIYVAFGALIFATVVYAVKFSNNRVPKGDLPSLLSPFAPHLSRYPLSYNNNTEASQYYQGYAFRLVHQPD